MNTEKLIKDMGGTSAVASLLGITPPSVSGWRASGVIPKGRLISLAVLAEEKGVSSRKEIFPNDWQKIWPELAMAQPTAQGQGEA